MLTKYVTLVLIVGILNSRVIKSEIQNYELPNIHYNYIGNDDSEPNICDKNSINFALNTVSDKMQVIIEKTFTKKIELMEISLNNIIEKTLANKLELLEKSLKLDLLRKINETISVDSASQITLTNTISNLTNVVQTMSQKLTNLENRFLELQRHKVNVTTPQNNTKGNETNCVQCECMDTSDARLLHVTVPSSVRPRTDVWKYHVIPDIDDLDLYMSNVTGCQYMAAPSYTGSNWRPVSTSSGGARWRLRYAVRGENTAVIRVTMNDTYDYRFAIGYQSNTQTIVFGDIRQNYLLQRATPGVMSREQYTQFHYIQLEDGVLSFGAVGDSPWWRANVTMSAGDVLQMEYATDSSYGGKILVCA